MANKYDLKTEYHFATGGVSFTTEIGSNVVPTGKKRYLTHIRVTLGGPLVSISTNVEALVASGTTNASDADYAYASANAKLDVGLASLSGINAVQPFNEVQGSIEQPILSVAGGKYMLLSVASGGHASESVFVQYYDE